MSILQDSTINHTIYNMTKGSELQETKDMIHISDKMPIEQTVKEVLIAARDEHRLTCGLYESGLVLEMNPDSIMCCVLPMNKSEDVTLDIHYTLIEAFCLENNICLLKVDSADKLSQLIGDRENDCKSDDQQVDPNDNEYYLGEETEFWLGGSTDYNCILIEYPQEKCSELEADLLQYHKETCALVPQPIIELDK